MKYIKEKDMPAQDSAHHITKQSSSDYAQTTEWEDIQIRLGNLKALDDDDDRFQRMKKKKNRNGNRKMFKWVNECEFSTLNDCNNDDNRSVVVAVEGGNHRSDRSLNPSFARDEDDYDEEDDEEEEFLRLYREKRIEEFKRRTGTKVNDDFVVDTVTSKEWSEKVTNGSRSQPVVVLLSKTNDRRAELIERCLTELAKKFHGTKFFRAEASEAIKNYPSRNVPTIILYRDGDVVENIVGMEQFGGLKATPELVRRRIKALGGEKTREFFADIEDEDERERIGRIKEEMNAIRLRGWELSKNNNDSSSDSISDEDDE